MFHEPRYDGHFSQILTAEQVIERCGFLWAFNHIWAEGVCSETGSLHDLNMSVLTQTLASSDSVYEIFFEITDQHIRQAKQVPKLEQMKKSAHFEMEPNPKADGATIAERIIAAIDLPLDWIQERSKNGSLTINQIVIRGPGAVDRTEHYYIYERDSRSGLKNLVPLILDCALGFVPKRFKKTLAPI